MLCRGNSCSRYHALNLRKIVIFPKKIQFFEKNFYILAVFIVLLMSAYFILFKEVAMFATNNVDLSGFVTKDPQVEKTKTGRTRCTFSIAVPNNSQVDSNSNVSYFDIETWNRLAEFCAGTVTKGRHVVVNGRLRQDRWEGTDGKMRSRIKLVGKSIRFLEKPKVENMLEEEIAQVS